MKFRKKPVVVEAVPAAQILDAVTTTWENLPEWVRDAYRTGTIGLPPVGLSIHTLEGRIFADPGDWIIRGVKGELYPCKPDIFAATYESVEGEAA